MHGLRLASVGAAVVAVAMTATACGSSTGDSGESSAGDSSTATSPATADASTDASTQPPDPQLATTSFLSGYVTGDGRVLRTDQGNDIVSEGQAYGMLIAELAGRDDLARTIWQWTASHLRRGDGLLAFHADENGNVLDESSAADADILTAYALLRYDGAHPDAMHTAGDNLARAVLAHESTVPPDGRARPRRGLLDIRGERRGRPLVLDAGRLRRSRQPHPRPALERHGVDERRPRRCDDTRRSIPPPGLGTAHGRRRDAGPRAGRVGWGAVRLRRTTHPHLVLGRLLVVGHVAGRIVVAAAEESAGIRCHRPRP